MIWTYSGSWNGGLQQAWRI